MNYGIIFLLILTIAYLLYKRIHSYLQQDYQKNTEELIKLNKRYYQDEESLEELRKRLEVNSSQSILETYKARHVYIILNPHGGNTKAITVNNRLIDYELDMGEDSKTILNFN